MTSEAKPRPVGRRPGPNETRDAILVAAKRHFAQLGFTGASMRTIARDADVDPALINHFFGSKARLFIAATELPLEPAQVVSQCLRDGRERVGHHVAAVFLGQWRTEEYRSPILALLRLGIADEHASSVVHEFLLDQILLPMLQALGADQRELRAGLVSAHLTGLGLGRYVYGLIPTDRVDEESIIEAVAPTLQHYLTGDLPAAVASSTRN